MQYTNISLPLAPEAAALAAGQNLQPLGEMENSEADLKRLLSRRASVKKWASKNRERLRKYRRDRHAKDPERFRNQQREYNKRNPERRSLLNRNWMVRNSARRKAYMAQWNKENPHRRKAYDVRRRFIRRQRELNADVGDKLVDRIVARSKKKKRFKCYYCEQSLPINRMHIDHLVPVSKNGKHITSNVCESCDTCNHEKRDRDVNKFYPKQQALLPL